MVTKSPTQGKISSKESAWVSIANHHKTQNTRHDAILTIPTLVAFPPHPTNSIIT